MSIKKVSGEVAFASGKYVKERKYWTDKLSGELVKSTFPYEYNNGNRRDLRPGGEEPAVKTFRFPEEQFLTLSRVSNKSDSRLFMILVSGLVLLLNKYVDNNDVIIGIPIDKQEIDADFINTVLALRGQLTDDMTFKELLLGMREVIIEASEHQNYPVKMIPYDLGMDFTEDDFPLFDVAILLENIHERRYLDGIKLNMIFSFLKTGTCIEGTVEYTPSLYGAGAVERIIDNYTGLLQRAFGDVNAKVCDIDILSPEERRRLLFEFNKTGADYPGDKTIHELFREQVEKTPDNQAVLEIDSGRSISYRRLNKKADQLAHILQGKGVGRETVVGILGERQIEIVVGILGILKAGGTYLPIDATNPDERIKFILEDSNASAFLSQKHLIEKHRDILQIFPAENVLPVDDFCSEPNPDFDAVPDTGPTGTSTPGNLVYIIYTSGTTGEPKGVMIEHRSLVNYITFAAGTYVNGEPIDFPFYTSLSFDLTVTSIFTPLVTGNSIVIYGGWDQGNLVEKIVGDNKVGAVKLTPSHLHLIKNFEVNGNSSIRRFIVGGELLETQIARDISDNFNGNIEIYNEYGPTEATVGCMIHRFDPRTENGKSVSIGKPQDNSKIYLLNKKLQPVPMGAVGEIYVSGAGIARGYYKRDRLTSERFLPNPYAEGERLYKTGDLAKWRDDGTLEFLERIDQQVKIRGFRIELGEIEAQLLKHEDVEKAVVITRESPGDKRDNGGGSDKFLCAYFVSNRPLSASDLESYLSGKLPDYMIPTYFAKLDDFPLTPNGKLDRRALPEIDIASETPYVAPRNETEKQLVSIWSDILGFPEKKIGIDENFFKLGGHSLKATVLISKLHRLYDVKIRLAEVFRLPTIRVFSQYLDAAAEETFVSIKPAEKREYYALSAAQKRLYILQHLRMENVSYNMQLVFELEGRLSREKLEGTFRSLIRRHENFRTAFELVNDEPVQRIYESFAFDIEYYKTADPAGIDRIVTGFPKTYNLDQIPLMRVGLIETGPHRHVMMLDMHHIVTDGISMNVFVKECMALYGGEDLPPLKLQYKDYSQWQNSPRQRESMKKQESYWLKQFEGDIPVLDLPTDYVRPRVQSFEGNRVRFEMEPGKTRALRQMVLDEGSTLYMTVLALYTVLLAKIGGRDDIVVGAPIAGRKHSDLQEMMGMFVNLLPFRNYPQEEKTFREFLAEVTRRSLEAFDNQEYQFEDLVERLGVKRKAGRNPLFDVAFALENYETQSGDIREIQIPGLTLKPYWQVSRVAKYDLVFYAIETEDNILFAFEYCTKLFKEETVHIFAGYMKKIINAVLENPGIKLAGIDITSEKDKEEMRNQFFDDLEDE